ncbi:hypothetical protein PUN28_003868 [Cardiocondyla obscurior]|uniref:Uncharacterized protein n=1 Tax=Cardiocondyla obscurior TaxID=286306 RepID=A0AAW2GNF9_9HYME
MNNKSAFTFSMSIEMHGGLLYHDTLCTCPLPRDRYADVTCVVEDRRGRPGINERSEKGANEKERKTGEGEGRGVLYIVTDRTGGVRLIDSRCTLYRRIFLHGAIFWDN